MIHGFHPYLFSPLLSSLQASLLYPPSPLFHSASHNPAPALALSTLSTLFLCERPLVYDLFYFLVSLFFELSSFPSTASVLFSSFLFSPFFLVIFGLRFPTRFSTFSPPQRILARRWNAKETGMKSMEERL